MKAWKTAIDFVDSCLAVPGAVKFMKKERIDRSEVFTAVFKLMADALRDTPASTEDEPQHLPLQSQMATLSAIIHPVDIANAISMMQKIPPELLNQTIPSGVDDLDNQNAAPGISVSTSGPVVTSSSSSSQMVLGDLGQPLIGNAAATIAIPTSSEFLQSELPTGRIEIDTEFIPDWETSRPWDNSHSETEGSSSKAPIPDDEHLLVQPVIQKSDAQTTPSFVADDFNPIGLWPKDSDGSPTRHWQRTSPPVFHTTKQVLQEFGKWKQDAPQYDIAMLHCWLGKRPLVNALLQNIQECPYAWENLGNGSHDFGKWWYAPLRRSIPFHSDLCRVQSVTSPQRVQFEKSIHSTNYYGLANVLTNGLQCGPWDVKRKRGIFSFKPMSLVRAKSSSGYRTYSDLLHNGYFWGVALELSYPADLSQRIGKIAADQQLVTPQEETYITAIWFHCVHISDHRKSEDCLMWCSCDDWKPEYEMRMQQLPFHDMGA